MPKVIIVTGVSRGIGRAIVNVLADSGRDVKIVGIARSDGPLKTLKHELGDKFDFLCADVTDEQRIEQFIKEVADKYGGIDAIVANAGCLEPVQDVNHISVREWKKLFDINYFSIVSLVSFAMPFLKISTSGDIIFVSSGASQKAYVCELIKILFGLLAAFTNELGSTDGVLTVHQRQLLITLQ